MKSTTLKLGTLVLALFAFSFADAQEKKKATPENMFKKIDTNEDGSITLEEFKNKKSKREVSAERLEKGFAKMDADSNGSVTLEEFEKAAMDRKKGKKKQE